MQKGIEALSKSSKMAIAALLLIFSVLIFNHILNSQLTAFLKFLSSALLLAFFGYVVSRFFGYEYWYGVLLVRSRLGLRLLDELAQRQKKVWENLCNIGMVVGFGMFAYFLLPVQRLSLKAKVATFAAGAFFLMLFVSVFAPLSTSILISMLSGSSEFASAGQSLQSSISQFSFVRYVMMALLLIGGLSLMTMAGMLTYAAIIVASIINVLFTGAPLSSVSPGGTPIIPGINIPLIEGVASLAIILLVHEGLHGIIARMHGFKVKSTGLVFFGFLPFGAFVDIDEKELLSGERPAQNSIFVAGSTANFIAAFVLLALLFAFIAATESFRLDGIYVEETGGAVPKGAIIHAVGGKPVSHAISEGLSPNAEYVLQTSKGEYALRTDQEGKLGIKYSVADRKGLSGVYRYHEDFGWMAGLARFFALAFALNFLIGTINLIPIPLFDGFHIMKNGLGAGIAYKVVAGAAAVAFALNLLPWLFR